MFIKRLLSAIQRRGGIATLICYTYAAYRRHGIKGAFQWGAGSQLDCRSSRYLYQKWIRRYDSVDPKQRSRIQQYVSSLEAPPLISIVMSARNAKPSGLQATFQSLMEQLYPHWELCISVASADLHTRAVVQEYAFADPRIKIERCEPNESVSVALNSALARASGEWVGLLGEDDLLSSHALYCVARAILETPVTQLIYSDEDEIDEYGRRYNPYFKCDWNVDLFYSQNMFGHFGVFRKTLLDDVGGFRTGFDGAQDYDLVLRCIEHVEQSSITHIPRILYHRRGRAESGAVVLDGELDAIAAGKRALDEHFARVDQVAHVEHCGQGYRVHYSIPEEPPLVTLIIPTRNALGLMRQCIDSIVSKTGYPYYEIIVVDNGSDDAEALSYFEALKTDTRASIRVLRDDRPFNYSALNNAAVEQARGSFVALINNDIEVISENWLTEMVGLARQPGVGAVGAKLFYPDDTLQHGGVVLGVGGVAGHAHLGLPRLSHGYFGRACLSSAYSVVTAACLVVRKAIYEEVGGLNEKDLTVAFNDVDFCLRVLEAGYRNVWTPYAELYHHESATRGRDNTPEKQARFAKEIHYMQERWGDRFMSDPAYSPNLTLGTAPFTFSLAWPPRVEQL